MPAPPAEHRDEGVVEHAEEERREEVIEEEEVEEERQIEEVIPPIQPAQADQAVMCQLSEPMDDDPSSRSLVRLGGNTSAHSGVLALGRPCHSLRSCSSL